MNPTIKSLTVRDFRSIRGEVTIPLDSPVVLIHGQNGAGKTSLLSAIELGLTGHLSSLLKLDPNLREHLVHKEAEDAFVSVSAGDLPDCAPVGEFLIKNGVITGKPLLSPSLAKLYSERSYLAQSTLSRLLEIYQNKEKAGSASPLTLFVKDLLGLDSLDALIDGLHDAADVRRLRGGAVRYWVVRDQIPTLEDDAKRLARELSAAESQEKELSAFIRSQLTTHWPTAAELTPEACQAFLTQQSQEAELQRLIRLRREIAGTLEQWLSVESPVGLQQREAAERAVQDTQAKVQEWLDTTGQRLTSLFARLDAFFPDLPSPTQNRPEYARMAVRSLASTELDRCNQVLTRDAEAASKVASIQADLTRLNARLKVVDDQISQHSGQAGQLAQALSTLLPHIHTEDCPVCGRDFSEVSETPLAGHVAQKVASLTQAAGRLTALSKERSEAATSSGAQSRALSAAQSQVMGTDARNELKTRSATLADFLSAIDQLQQETIRGEQLFVDAGRASAALTALRGRDQQAAAIRESAHGFAQALVLPSIGATEPLRSALDRFQAHVTALEDQLSAKEAARRQLFGTLRELELKQKTVRDIRDLWNKRREEQRRLNAAKQAGDRVIEQARDLANAAKAERSEIVRRVFNESLNTVWRDLFVRLAPDEPFVPAFALPESAKGTVEAKLETLYRSGRKGGNPRAMLSAGNLNTAALTLFLALHLSVRSPLPWLVIDDPVQSMDEVHISQFAALLRTLTKQHGRQVIIAVHEKPLFEYLALELSPAFPGDRLVTVEMGRSASDMTVAEYEPKSWTPDQALAA